MEKECIKHARRSSISVWNDFLQRSLKKQAKKPKRLKKPLL